MRKKHDGDLLGAQILADERHALWSAQNAFDRANRALFLEVFLGLLAERETAVAPHGHDGWRPFLALVVGQDFGMPKLEIRHHGIAGAEVDADVGHGECPSMNNDRND